VIASAITPFLSAVARQSFSRLSAFFHGLENGSMPMAQGFWAIVFQFPGVTTSLFAL
jgi:hypothetical protein